MPSASAYREKAMACIAQANAIKDPQRRAAMLSIAKGYRDIADCVGARHQGAADVVWLIVTPKVCDKAPDKARGVSSATSWSARSRAQAARSSHSVLRSNVPR